MAYQSFNNPFGLDTPKIRFEEFINSIEFAIVEGHIFSIIEIPLGISDEKTDKLPNWEHIDKFSDGSLCGNISINALPLKIYTRYKYEKILEDTTLCEKCRERLHKFITNKNFNEI